MLRKNCEIITIVSTSGKTGSTKEGYDEKATDSRTRADGGDALLCGRRAGRRRSHLPDGDVGGVRGFARSILRRNERRVYERERPFMGDRRGRFVQRVVRKLHGKLDGRYVFSGAERLAERLHRRGRIVRRIVRELRDEPTGGYVFTGAERLEERLHRRGRFV